MFLDFFIYLRVLFWALRAFWNCGTKRTPDNKPHELSLTVTTSGVLGCLFPALSRGKLHQVATLHEHHTQLNTALHCSTTVPINVKHKKIN